MADKILSQMAMFDFNAPIQTVMMFDVDSDEETYSSSSKRQRIDRRSLIPGSLHHEVDIINSSDEDVHIIMDNDCIIENKETKNTTKTKNVKNKNIDNPKITDVTASAPIIRNESKNINNVDENNVKNIRNEQQTSRCDNPNSSATYSDTSEKSIPEQVNTVTSLNSSDLTDKEEMSAYLKKLINSVSEHLLVILGAYTYYVNAKKTGNQMLIEKSRKHYMGIKYHFFNLSYLVVETLFVPQDHTQSNYIFARNFIDCTIRIAKAKSIKCTFEQIESLYLEMLEWTKEKSNKVSLIYSTFTSHSTVSSINRNMEITKPNAQKAALFNNHYVVEQKGNERASTLIPDQTPSVTSKLINPSMAIHGKPTNSVHHAISKNNACRSCKSQNNHDIVQNPNSFGDRYVCNNNLSNPAVWSTRFSNGQFTYQNCSYCQQQQYNVAVQHFTTTSKM